MEIIYCPVAMMYPLLMYSACACAFRIAASSVSGTLSTTKSGNMTVSTGNNVAYSIIATPSLPRASRWQTKDITPTSSSTIHSTSKQQLNSTLTVILSPSVVMDQCLNCNGTTKESDRYFLFTMLGIGIGSTLFIFIVLLLVVICRRLVKQRISDRENELAYVRDGEDFLRSKESIFSSSTLQLHGGVSNDGLELDSFQSPRASCNISKQSPDDDKVIVENEQMPPDQIHWQTIYDDAIPVASNLQNNSDNEQEYGASIKLLQDWTEHLENDNSDQYKELQLEVEQSVKDIYRMKDGFIRVKLAAFRKGSVIADLMLFMLAMVQDPFEILEEAVQEGKLGSLQVDDEYFVKRRKGCDYKLSGVEANQNMHPAVPACNAAVEYYESEDGRMLLKRSKLESRSDNESDSIELNRSALTSNNSCQQNDWPTSSSPLTNRSHVTRLESNDWTKRKSSLDSEKDRRLEEAELKRSPYSLVDLTNANSPVILREQRDSGIGSMQELSASEVRLNRGIEKLDRDSLKNFSDLSEHCSLPRDGERKIVGSTQQLDQIDEDVPHVALYDFLGENDQELSIKQGDVVHVIERGLAGWVKVMNSEDMIGWVPESFLVHVSQSQLTDTQQTVETLQFFDNIMDQLENDSSSNSSAVSTPDDEKCNEYVHKEFEKDVAATNVQEGLNRIGKRLEIQVKRCKSVFRFDGKGSSELSFKVGEIIKVLKISEVGWWKGTLNGIEGWFPSSYVMPLNEESEVPVESSDNDPVSRATHRLMCLRSGSDVNKQRKLNLKLSKHKYQSLQRTARKREEYAHLYLQILKQESKSDESIPSLFKSASLNVINNIKVSAADWPNRAPPAPPKEEIKKEGLKIFPSASHSEPPNRPIPLPPTGKPSLGKFSAMQPRKSSENVSSNNDQQRRIAPPSRARHEHASHHRRELSLEINPIIDDESVAGESST